MTRMRTPFLTLASLVCAAPGVAQTPVALMRGGEELPNSNLVVQNIRSMSVEATGEFAIALAANGATTGLIWGSPDNAAPRVLRWPRPVNGISQRQFRGAIGLGDESLFYRTTVAPAPWRQTIWKDDELLFGRGDSGPEPNTSWQEFSAVSATTSGELLLRASYQANFGQAIVTEGYFIGSPPVKQLATGDQLAGLTGPISSIEAWTASRSPSGDHALFEVRAQAPAAMVLDGELLRVNGVPLVTGTPLPGSLGLGSATWSFADCYGVNDQGDYFVASGIQLGGTRFVLIHNDAVLMRENVLVNGVRYERTLDGVLSSSGRLIHVSRYESAAGVQETGIFVDTRLVYRFGDPIDWDGDGSVDPEWTVESMLGGVSDGRVRLAVSGDRTIWFQVEMRMAGASFPVDAVLQVDYSIGENYCDAEPNSTGAAATMEALGSGQAADDQLLLAARNLPQSSTGYFLVGDQQASILFPGGSAGRLCIGGSLGRFSGPGQVQNSGAAGAFELAIDLTSLPQPNGTASVMAGDIWNFSAWFRDQVGGSATSNFANGLAVQFR